MTFLHISLELSTTSTVTELVLCLKMLKKNKTKKPHKYRQFPLKVLIGCLSIFLGGGWRRLQEANWPEEGQASCLPSSTDRWICGQPDWACLWAQGCCHT